MARRRRGRLLPERSGHSGELLRSSARHPTAFLMSTHPGRTSLATAIPHLSPAARQSAREPPSPAGRITHGRGARRRCVITDPPAVGRTAIIAGGEAPSSPAPPVAAFNCCRFTRDTRTRARPRDPARSDLIEEQQLTPVCQTVNLPVPVSPTQQLSSTHVSRDLRAAELPRVQGCSLPGGRCRPLARDWPTLHTPPPPSCRPSPGVPHGYASSHTSSQAWQRLQRGVCATRS